VVDAVAALALLAGATAEVVGAADRSWPVGAHVVVLGLLAAAVVARRTEVTVLAAAAVAVQAFGDFVGSAGELVLSLLLVVRAAAAPARRERVVQSAALSVALLAVLLNDPGTQSLTRALPTLVLFGAAAGLGASLARRTRAVDEARAAQERQAQEAVARERTQLARELHDVVTHSLSVVVVQAGAARLDAPPEQGERLAAIEDTARSALVEMRRLLGILRGDPDAELAPQPGLDQLPELLAAARAAGVEASLRVEGTARALPPGLDLTAYRLVQEGVTNVLRHAQASQVQVVVRWTADRVHLEVLDDGRPGAPSGGGGRGLLGLGERAALYGGSLEHGPRPEGGYRLHGELPLATVPERVAR
jgi:signal transduction histidine kinase